jgi:hypothetical protein
LRTERRRVLRERVIRTARRFVHHGSGAESRPLRR